MSEWHDLMRQIRELQTKVDRAELLDLKTVQNTLHNMLGLMHSMALRMEMERVPPYQADLTDLRIQTLTNRVETNEAAQNHRLSLTERQIKKDRDAILEKLDAILQRLPEPPQGFDV